MTWIECIAKAKEAQAFNKKLLAYHEKSWYKKLLSTEPHTDLKTTNPDAWMQDAARDFNKKHNLNKTVVLNNCMYTKVYMHYQAYTTLPLLVIMQFDGNCYYQRRRAFKEDGSYEEWGIAYPYSESGVTGTFIERNSHIEAPEEFKHDHELFIKLTKEIQTEWLNK